MKQLPTSSFFISLFFLCNLWFVQAQNPVDTISFKQRYGLRLGVDLSKPARALLEENYSGIEILGDFRIDEKYFVAAELGYEQLPHSEDNLRVTSNGTYIKAGLDYNAYDNWAGMENMLFVGLRVGFSSFSQTLEDYTITRRSQYFPPTIIGDPVEDSGLNASWAELIGGVKVELFRNLFLGANVQLKYRITEKRPPNFDNLTIPGFNRTYDFSQFGVGYGYTLSYLIPFYKKEVN